MSQSIVMLLLLALAVVFGVAAGFYLYSRWRNAQRRTAINIETFEWVARRPVLFENPRAWLAVKAETAQEVQAALGLRAVQSCSWADVDALPPEQLFIAPPVNGWVIVFGDPLPDPADDIDEFFKFITGLSRRAGLVIYFGADRLFDQHAWVKVINGRIVRAYAWADTVLWNQGELTQAERDLRLRCEPYGPPGDPVPPRARAAARFNCDRLAALAARWCLDPKSIDSRKVHHDIGIAGELPQRKLH